VSRIILHLHPQGAYIGRAIDYIVNSNNSHPNIIPVFFPTFLDHYNQHFTDFLRTKAPNIQHYNQLTFDTSHILDLFGSSYNLDRFSNLRTEQDDYDLPYYHQISHNSVIDTLSRNLVLPSLAYFTSSYSERKTLENTLMRHHRLHYNRALKYFISMKVDTLVLSHMNYIYYTAPLLAALRLGMRVVIIHGGYNETIEINEPYNLFQSPSHVRKILLGDKLSLLPTTLLTSDQSGKIYPTLSSISDASFLLKRMQHQFTPRSDSRLIIVNHQIISEICYHFPSQELSLAYPTRYDLLLAVLLGFCTTLNHVIFRYHPSTKSYPGESELISNILKKFPNIILHNDTSTSFSSLLNKFQLYPEIYSLGGNSTCELLASSISAYSVGECLLPPNCENYQITCPKQLTDFFASNSRYSRYFNDLDALRDCDLYLRCFKQSQCRRGLVHSLLQRLDDFYHFASIRDPEFQLHDFIEQSCNLTFSNSNNSRILSSQQHSMLLHEYN